MESISVVDINPRIAKGDRFEAEYEAQPRCEDSSKVESNVEEHGGQSWDLLGDKYVDDFSVTTNPFGPPEKAMEAAIASMAHVGHYPKADCEPALSEMAKFVGVDHDEIVMGNGASELIELVIRMSNASTWRPGPYCAQYMEYERAANMHNLRKTQFTDASADLTIIIRPNSPTGHFMPISQLEEMMHSSTGMYIIDESFLFFHGDGWKRESAMNLLHQFPNRLFIIQSWTKIWRCPGLRIGTVVSSKKWIKLFKSRMVPWSVNMPVQHFVRAAILDRQFLEETWATIPKWKALTMERCTALGWKVMEDTPLWVPWVFADAGDVETVRRCAQAAMEVGCPIRTCGSHGHPTYIRLGIRKIAHQDILFRRLADVMRVSSEAMFASHSSEGSDR